MCKDASWEEVEDILKLDGGTGNPLEKQFRTCVRRVFFDLQQQHGICHISATKAGPKERPLQYMVGVEVQMDADFYEISRDLQTLIVRSASKIGRDYEGYPYITRDHMKGWRAEDPVKRLAFAQSVLIKRRKAALGDDGVSAESADEQDADEDADEQEGDEQEEYDYEEQNDNDYSAVSAGAIDLCSDDEIASSPSESLECVNDRVSKRIRDEVGERALAAGLAESKRRRDEKLIEAVRSMHKAEDDLKEEVEKAEHEIEEARKAEEENERLVEDADDEHTVSRYAKYTRRKRAANRTKHWQTVKERQLDSDGHLPCAICGFWDHRDTGLQMSDTTLRLDHTIALELDGADDDPDNLQILCGNCDNRKTESDNKKYRAKLAKKRKDAKLAGLVFRPESPHSD